MSTLFPSAKRVMLVGLFSLLTLLLLSACGSTVAEASLNLDDANVFKEVSGNYTVSMDFNFTAAVGGETVYRAMTIEGQRSADPDAATYRMEPNDPAIMGGLEFMELSDLEGTSYRYAHVLGCQRVSYDEFSSPFDSFMREGGILTGEAQFRFSGEIVNGVATDVYTISLENIAVEDVISWYFTALEQGLIYVAQEDRAIVRLVLVGTGTSQFLSGDAVLVGDIYYQVDFTPTDERFDIQSPESCNPILTPADID